MATSSENSINEYMRSLGIFPGQKTSNRQDFAAILIKNTEIVDELLALSKRLESRKQLAASSQVLDIARQILENNKKLRTKVGEVLTDE